MTPLLLALLLLLHVGDTREEEFLYFTPGEDAILPCGSGTQQLACDQIEWVYNKDSSGTLSDVRNGRPDPDSPRFGRLRLFGNCSLRISNLTKEDAGLHICQHEWDSRMYVSILSISLSPPNADPNNDELTLQCALSGYYDRPRCDDKSVRWVIGDGDPLDRDGDGYRVNRQYNCVRFLTVETKHTRTYSCQFVKDGDVKIQASYSTGRTTGRPHPGPTVTPDGPVVPVVPIVRIVVGALVVLLVVAALVYKFRRRSQVSEEVQKPSRLSDEGNVTYANVNIPGTSAQTHDEAESNVTYAS